MLAITIVLFVVPHNQQIVTIRQLFTCHIPMFRNQNLNIQKETILDAYTRMVFLFYDKIGKKEVNLSTTHQ